MTLPRWLGPGAIAFLVLWVLLLTAGRSSFFRDPGTFWHTTTGELILSDGFIRTDPYTFTFGGTWWVPYQWLGEVAMALAHRAGGFDTQLLGAVTILAAVFAWLTTRFLRTGLHPIAVGTVVALGLAAAASHFHVRPHLFTILCMTVTAVALADADLGRLPLRRLGWLVPLFVIWTNVHGGVIGGIATVGIVACGWVVFWRLGLRSPLMRWTDAGLVGAVAFGCAVAALVNPYGLDLLRTWHVIMGEPALKEIIQEHRPLDLTQPYAWSILAFAAVYLFVLLGVSWREVRVTWLLPLVWLVMAFDRVRHAPLFVVVGLVALAAMWPRTRWARWLAQNRPDYQKPLPDPTDLLGEPSRRPAWANLWLPAVAVLIAFVLQLGRVPVPVIGSGWAQHDPTHWPVDLLDVLKANEPTSGVNNHIFNGYIDGGFVIYHAPGYRVFVDDRCEVFGGAWLKEFVDATENDSAAAIARWERRYGLFDFALTRTDTGFDDYFKDSPEWVCLKRTDTAAFYKRK
ncbi:MAG TPA: hypothetical protein VKE74_29520 [Gemmataceae bacterium]|nr:hypothetical protein [Gemmataceae bacterium]